MSPVYILLVFPSQKEDHAAEIKTALVEDLEGHGSEALVDIEKNERDAQRRLDDPQRQYDLFVISPDIPAHSRSVRSHREGRGLAFVAAIRRRGMDTPVIVLAERKDPSLLAEARKHGRCQVVTMEGESWDVGLSTACTASVLRGPQKETGKEYSRTLAKVDIYLVEGENLGSYTIDAEHLYVERRPLQVNWRMMAELARRSDNVARSPDWEDELHGIGLDLYHHLFECNGEFSNNFSRAVAARPGGQSDVRIRFVVGERVHSVALEALIDEHEKFQMLRYPIYRTARLGRVPEGVCRPLFRDLQGSRPPIRCLIIEADASGPVPGMKDRHGEPLVLEEVSNVKEEAANLEKYFREHKADFSIKEVGPVPSQEGQDQSDCVRHQLNLGPWDLVHFAGHSRYDESTGTGYVFFVGKDTPEPLPIYEFAEMLQKAQTRFVYLSSCQSSTANFAFELASHGIPAIVGYRWDIDDDKAGEHARLFYEKLFEGPRALEDAFLETRKEMHRLYKTNRIWAAPVLVIQSRD